VFGKILILISALCFAFNIPTLSHADSLCSPGNLSQNKEVFFQAYFNRDLNLLNACLKDGVDVNSQVDVLLSAIANVWLDGVKALVNSGTPLNSLGAGHELPIWRASYIEERCSEPLADAYAILDFLVSRGADIKAFDPYMKSTALHSSAEACNLTLVKRWIAAGLDPNARDFYNDTPLYLAASGCYISQDRSYTHEELDSMILEITNALISAGTNPNIPNKENGTALSALASMGRVEAMRVLLKNHADPNIEDDIGCTPLNYTMMRTRSCKKMQIAQELLKKYGGRPGSGCGQLPYKRLTFLYCRLMW